MKETCFEGVEATKKITLRDIPGESSQKCRERWESARDSLGIILKGKLCSLQFGMKWIVCDTSPVTFQIQLVYIRKVRICYVKLRIINKKMSYVSKLKQSLYKN